MSRFRATASAGLVAASSLLVATCAPSQSGGDVGNSDDADRASAAPICLFTDLDGTFVDYKDKEAVTRRLEVFFEHWDTHERPRGSILVYNTARSIRMYEALPADFPNFRPPDVLITGEGTEIRWLTSPLSSSSSSSSSALAHGHDSRFFEFVVDKSWANRIRAFWWDSGLRERVLSALDLVDEECIANLNVPENALNSQGEARHAITIEGGPGSEKRAADLLQSFSKQLNGGEFQPDESATSIRTVELAAFPAWGEDPIPQIITALPGCAGKGKAAQYVCDRLDIPESRCICAGDTLGDIAMLRDAGDMRFFAVANARDSLKAAVADERKRADIVSAFPCVVGNTGAAGVLEGLKRFRTEL